MRTTIIIVSFIAISLTAFLMFGNKTSSTKTTADEPAANVYIENDKQVIEISAKGGYTPRVTIAKAGLPTIVRIKTSGTFDCSSSLRIPLINYFKNLPPTGTTDIEVSAQSSGSTLRGLCSMGMYNFSIKFKG